MDKDSERLLHELQARVTQLEQLLIEHRYGIAVSQWVRVTNGDATFDGVIMGLTIGGAWVRPEGEAVSVLVGFEQISIHWSDTATKLYGPRGSSPVRLSPSELAKAVP